MLFTQALRQFAPNKKGLFHNNPSFEMVQYPQRRSSTEDLTKVTAAKPPSGRTKKKVMRRTNTDPGPLSADILTILLEQIPQLGSLSKKSDCSESSTYQPPAPFPVPDSNEPAKLVDSPKAQSSVDTTTHGLKEPVKDSVAPSQESKSQASMQKSTRQSGNMPGPITAHATSLSTPAAMSSSVSSLQSKQGATVTPPVSIPKCSTPKASYNWQLSSSLPDQCETRLRSSSFGSSPSSQHFALSFSQTTPSPTMRTSTPPSHSRLSPAYGPSANALSWQQTPSKPQVIRASQSQYSSSIPESSWQPYMPGSSSSLFGTPSSSSPLSYPSSSLSSSFSPSLWSSSSFSTPTTTTSSSSLSSSSSSHAVKSPKKWKPATFKPPPRTSSFKTNASATTKPVVQDSRYDYLTQFPSTERQISEKKPRQVREPDASYNKSLPEYLPIKSPSISDDRFDDFDFTPPVTVPAAKQELTRASAIGLYPFTAQSKKELSFKKGDTIYLTREIDKNWLEGEHHGNKGIFPRTYVEIVTSLEEARNLQVNTPSSEGKGRAKYRFKGETANELSVNKGEIVDLIRKIDANWWEVRHGNKAGIVPVAYLDVLREPQQGSGLSSPQPRSPMPKSPLSPGAGRGPLSPSQQAPRSPPVNRRDNYQPTSPYQTDMPSLGRQQPSQQNRAGQGPRAGSGSGGGRGVQQAGGRPAQNAGFHPKRPDGERYRAVYSYQPSNDDELEIMEGETVVVMEKCDDGWYVGFSESTGQFGTFPGNYVEKL